MDDEQLRKEKFRCDFDGPDGITIGDLFIKAANPIYNRRVHLKKGEYLLTELLDFVDLKKSRVSGALSKFIEMKWISVESPSLPRKEAKIEIARAIKASTDAITEIDAGIIKQENITNFASVAKQSVAGNTIGYPKESHPKIVETVSLDNARTVNSFAVSENDSMVTSTSLIEVYEKFNALRYFQKLKTIKETTDVGLLGMIASKSSYPQLVHNSKNRLKELQRT